MSIQNSHQIGDVKVMLKVGADGSGIESIEKTGTSGIVDTYTITMTDGSKSTFTVTNGSSIESIEKTSTVGLVDTYTITLTNGDTSTFEVHNASGGGMLAHILITSDAGSIVTVTTPSGDVITATQVTGSTTQWECDTQEYGVHIIDAVLEGDDAQYSLTVDACKVYSIDDSHMHATITVTYPQGFTCRCQGNGENYYANSNPYTFSVHSLGTFTITATDGTTTYTETVVISSSSQAETIYCPSVANSPTEDVQLWLMYGDITDKNYTTLAEVLADTTTYSALIADHDAVDYLKRSVGWAVNDGLVPKMTDNTHPSGEVGASSTRYGAPWKAFTDDWSTSVKYPSDSWAGDGTTNQWLSYAFTSAVKVSKLQIRACKEQGGSSACGVKNFKVQYSDDNSVWTDEGNSFVYQFTNGGTPTVQEFTLDDVGRHQYWRVYVIDTSASSFVVSIANLQFFAYTGNGITEDSTAMSILGLNNYASDTLLSDADWLEAICNSQYFESVLNTKVPVMTSNTTPSGECICDSYYPDNPAYFAFDGNNSTYWSSNTASSSGVHIGYKFTSPIKIYKIHWLWYNATTPSITIKVRRSDDGLTWTDVLTQSVTSSGSQTDIDIIVDATNEGLCWDIYKDSATTTGDRLGTLTLQFYGRVDI